MTPEGRERRAAVVRWLRDWLRSLALALVAWFLLRTFVLEGFHISSGSMERTLLVGDWLFVNKALYGAEIPVLNRRLPAFREPRDGDIVVFDSSEEPGLKIVKRVVGVPGDTVRMHAGRLYRNGHRLVEPYVIHEDSSLSVDPGYRNEMRAWQARHYIGGDTAGYAPDLEEWGPLVVPPDSLFVMGDNRDDSYDSRFWGFLPRDHVLGSPWIIYFSLDTVRGFPPSVRWSRLLTRLH